LLSGILRQIILHRLGVQYDSSRCQQQYNQHDDDDDELQYELNDSLHFRALVYILVAKIRKIFDSYHIFSQKKALCNPVA
jgi:hypothetical protein